MSRKEYFGKHPFYKKIIEEKEKEKKEYKARYYQILKENQFKYYSSICLIIKDENKYLLEWLHWHISIGIEHFYIYDHNSSEPVETFLKNSAKELIKYVTIINWRGKHEDAQPNAYNDCLKKYSYESRWIGFIDTDEQVRLIKDDNIKQFLNRYEEYSGVFAIWVTYDANGMVKETNEPLRERFTHVSNLDKWARYVGKVFVQGILMEEMVIHNGKPIEYFYIVNERKEKMKPYSLMCERPTTEYICVDHYYTKSYEEWKNKIVRGSGHAKFQRRYEDFFKLNPDMLYCKEDINIIQNYE